MDLEWRAEGVRLTHWERFAKHWFLAGLGQEESVFLLSSFRLPFSRGQRGLTMHAESGAGAGLGPDLPTLAPAPCGRMPSARMVTSE